jgi:hypothetical protein
MKAAMTLGGYRYFPVSVILIPVDVVVGLEVVADDLPPPHPAATRARQDAATR